MSGLAKTLVVSGLVLVALGVVVWLGARVLPLGRLPGDIVVERPGFTFYFPLGTSLLLSAVLSAVLWWLNR